MIGGVSDIASAAERTTALTIYSSAGPGAISPDIYKPSLQGQYTPIQLIRMIPGYAIVKEDRTINLPGKRSTIRFTDVASQIDPTTVTFVSLTDPKGTNVLDQNYEFDLVSTAKLMERFIDQQITVEQTNGPAVSTFTGKLLSAQGGLVLQDDKGQVQVINGYSNVLFPQLPGGLITRPTLVWDIETNKPGQHDTRVTYETKGITWWADYNMVFAEGKNANSGSLDIGAWVSIVNQSGTTYKDAKLKLIAGDVQRAPKNNMYDKTSRMRALSMESARAPGFEEKSFFEYHLYTLGRPTTIAENSTKQVELFPAARKVPCKKILVYNGLVSRFGRFGSPMMDRNFGVQSNKKVDIYLRFKNEKAIGMGMPLPAGRMRVSQLDTADGSLEFIGEDTIDHTPKDEQVSIKLGSAFDVVGERKQLDFKTDARRKIMDETIEIKIRNHKEEPVDVLVKESLYRWGHWKITDSSHQYEKLDSQTIHFPVTVKSDGEVTIRYTVHYTW